MITHWPSVGSSETLYSIASRLHYLSGGSSAPHTSMWLFGFATAGSQRFSPRNLDHFSELIHGRLGSPDRILRERTPIGQFAPFVSSQGWWNWVTWCRSLPAAHKPFLALRNFDLPSRTALRACPDCMAADQKALGSAIWRLEHQLVGSRVCIWHKRVLLEETTNLRRAGEYANAWLRPEDCAAQGQLRPCIADAGATPYWSTVSHAAWCICIHPRVTGDRLRTIIRTELAHAGVICSGKRTGVSSLAQWWQSLERPTFLTSGALASLEDSKWIHQTLLGRRHDHPLKWAVLAASVMAPDALSHALSMAPHDQLTLEGEWEPSVTNREDLLHPDVWRLLKAGANVATVSAQYGISAPKLRHALRLNPRVQRTRNQRITQLNRHSRREVIVSFLTQNPGSSRVDLLQAHSSELRWLEEHDPIWIAQMLGNSSSLRFRQRAFDFL